MFALRFTYRLVHRLCLNHKLVSRLVEEENGEVHVQDQDDPSRRDHMLDACHPLGDRGYEKICLKRSSPVVEYGGANHKSSSSKRYQERWSNSRKSRPSSSSSSGLCARQRYILIGFLFYRSHVV